MKRTLPSFETLPHDPEVVVAGVIELMKNKTMWENSATMLLKVLKNKVPKEHIHLLPKLPNHLSRILKDNVEILLENGIVAGKYHSGNRRIFFTKTPSNVISTKTIRTKSEGETIMETTTYKTTIREEVLTAIKELGPITTAEIAEVTLSNIDSVRSTISFLRKNGHNIVNRPSGKGTRELVYFYSHEPVEKPTKKPIIFKEVEPVKKPITFKDVTPETQTTENSVRPLPDLVERARYLTLALQRITIDDLMDNLNISEDSAEIVILAMASKYRKELKVDVTVQTKQ